MPDSAALMFKCHMQLATNYLLKAIDTGEIVADYSKIGMIAALWNINYQLASDENAEQRARLLAIVDRLVATFPRT